MGKATVLVLVMVPLVLTLQARAVIHADGLCLGNNGERTVKAGTTYRDSEGTWLCAPDNPSSTAGGWVLLKGTPSVSDSPVPTATPSETEKPTSTATRTDSAAAPREGNSGVPSSLPWLIGTAAALGTLGCFLVLRSALLRPRLLGWVAFRSGEQETKVDLSVIRGRATVGSLGKIRVQGPRVKPRHAEIFAERNEGGEVSVSVRSLEGAVSVVRRKAKLPVVFSQPLQDGDIILLGTMPMSYSLLVPKSQ